jgi:hypothetical protein
MILFFTNYRFHPRIGFKPIVPDRTARARDTKQFISRIKEIYKFLKAEICLAQARYEEYTNRKYKPAYKYYIS